MTFRILVGLPSFNEADTIAGVAADIDRGLRTLPFPSEPQLVNADNSSTDGTQAAFLAVPTTSSKSVLTTPYAGGKGRNWRTMLDLACHHDFDAILFMDTDLAVVPESWIHALLGAIHDGMDFCFPLRPPTWNGGDLTYQLAYPVMAGVFGANLGEPLCGDISLSKRAAELVLREQWIESELRFGVDFLLASVAVSHQWGTVSLATRRRNKLRSFSVSSEGYRMGEKFAEVALAIQHRAGLRLRQPPPKGPLPAHKSDTRALGGVVPSHDADIASLAESTSRRLRIDARDGAFAVFPRHLAERLRDHAMSESAVRGLGWPEWRECLFAWIRNQGAPAHQVIPTTLLETLFLNRVVGHHTEIAGTRDWYITVYSQARDTFEHRRALWNTPDLSTP